MILSEEQARTKWCPFSRTPASSSNDERLGVAAINRWPGEPSHMMASCIASDCMAWRWKTNSRLEAEEEAALRRQNETGESAEDARRHVLMHFNYRVPAPPVEGFCGLARRPRP